jgi:hypothetical protein
VDGCEAVIIYFTASLLVTVGIKRAKNAKHSENLSPKKPDFTMISFTQQRRNQLAKTLDYGIKMVDSPFLPILWQL